MASSASATDLHIFFLPLLAPGHMIPIADLAVLLAARGARSTIITTPANAEAFHPYLSPTSGKPNVHLLTIPFPPNVHFLPENVTGLPVPDVTPDFFTALCGLEPDFDRLLLAHHPDCIISDNFFPWTTALAKRHGIPRIAFNVTSYFSFLVMNAISKQRLHKSVSSPEEHFLVPGLPHPIKMTLSQMPEYITSPQDFLAALASSVEEAYGTVMNTFYELEPGYSESSKVTGLRTWHVGPVSSVCRTRPIESLRMRGGSADDGVFGWLDGKESGSVLYVCFGSLSRFTTAQFREIRVGLKAACRPFVWVVRDEQPLKGVSLGAGEEGGFVIKGWAPQLAILKHRAVGGFLTHCGWNSCLDGIAAGVPMVTWPLFADQPFNERLLVDVLGVGVGVGSMVNSTREEERSVVAAERVAAAVEAVMGAGEEAEDRRRRAREMKEFAAAAVGRGGSSDVELGRMVEELVALKVAKMKEASTIDKLSA